jgi:deoxycytidine triphosphate deaminase
VAGYKLTIGDEYYRDETVFYLPSRANAPKDAQSDYVEIPPFEVVVIKTRETLCLPRFLIGRWNIVVKQAYRGLLWVGGPQVDPGYVGHLFCPIYNLSDKHVRLEEREEIALIDFVKTTPFPYKDYPEYHRHDAPKWIRQGVTDKPILEKYVERGLKSALYTQAALRLNKLEQSNKDLGIRFSTMTMFMIGALAVIPALLAMMLPFYGASGLTASLWGPFAIGFSTFALGWSFVGSAKKVGLPKAVFPAGLAATFFLCALWFVYPRTAAYVDEFAGEATQLKQDLVKTDERVSSLANIVNNMERRQAVDGAFIPELRSQIRELQAALGELRSQVLGLSGWLMRNQSEPGNQREREAPPDR